jgi:hypothetical protein
MLGAGLCLAVAGRVEADDDAQQLCQAATLMAQAANADAGAWLDRHTRHDGMEVLCPIRTVHFRRHLAGPDNGPGRGWQQRKAQEWNSVNCASWLWRSAIDSGWIILASITTAAGERADLIATCDGGQQAAARSR